MVAGGVLPACLAAQEGNCYKTASEQPVQIGTGLDVPICAIGGYSEATVRGTREEITVASEMTTEALTRPEPVFGGTVHTVTASPRIPLPPATLEEARSAPGRAERIEAITRQ